MATPPIEQRDLDKLHEVVDFCANRFQLEKETLLRSCRCAPVVVARKHAIKYANALLPHLTCTQLGAFFGMHHTTILYHLDRLNRPIKGEKS